MGLFSEPFSEGGRSATSILFGRAVQGRQHGRWPKAGCGHEAGCCEPGAHDHEGNRTYRGFDTVVEMVAADGLAEVEEHDLPSVTRATAEDLKKSSRPAAHTHATVGPRSRTAVASASLGLGQDNGSRDKGTKLRGVRITEGPERRGRMSAHGVPTLFNRRALRPYCIKQSPEVVSGEGPCEGRAVEPTYGADGTVVGFTRAYNEQRALTLRQWVATLTSHLPGLYDTIKAPLAGLVAPDRTFITQYPTFIYKTVQGEVCNGGIFDASTWQWPKGAGAALNAQVAAAAGSDGWHGVGVNPKYFLGDGYCSSDPWSVSVYKALVNNLAGAFHATEAGPP